MNHPSLKVLQDYFEAELDSVAINSHLDSCDRCSLIIAQMAKVRQDISNKVFALRYDAFSELKMAIAHSIALGIILVAFTREGRSRSDCGGVGMGQTVEAVTSTVH